MTIDIPQWIEQDISPHTIAAVNQGGCDSGAYMPGTERWTATNVMAKHGEDVIDYLIETVGHIPMPDEENSWGEICCLYLSTAVETWCSAHEELEDWENSDPVSKLGDEE